MTNEKTTDEEKLSMKSSSLSRDLRLKIEELIPSCVTETVSEDGCLTRAIDFEALKRILSDQVVGEGKERYVMTWPGKSKAIRTAGVDSTMALRPCRKDSVDFENTRNIYIEGNNTDALILLRETYLGKVDMIYIDPPYNTKNDFIYSDDYSTPDSVDKKESGDYDDFGNRLTLNDGSDGKLHTKWLNMMYPNLLLARDFLSDTGVIFISIDDNEQANLKRMCDEIFGEKNFVTTFVWAAGRKNDSKLVSVSHEYILCYVRSMSTLGEKSIKWRERKQGLDDIYREYDSLKRKYGTDYQTIEIELGKWYKSLDPTNPAKNHKHYCKVDERGIYFPDNISWPGGGGPKYEVIHPITGKSVKIPSRGWLYSESRLKELIAENRIQFGIDETYVPCVKSYLTEKEYSAPYSVFYKDGRAATKRLRELMDSDVFQNPKDESIIQSLIQFCTNKDSIVMDFFSGSATTAHAVFLQNKLDGGNRSFILVQTTEPIENMKGTSEASKNVYENALHLLDGKPHNISEIGKERIRRAGKIISRQHTLNDSDVDVGFRVFKLDSSNMNDVYYSPEKLTKNILDNLADNIKSDRSGEDLLVQVMLEHSIELSANITRENIDGKEIYSVDDGYMIACFDSDITDDIIINIAKKQPRLAVFRDKSMASDAVAINYSEIFKTYSPNTKIKVI